MKSPLTDFILKVMDTPADKLARANVDKLAAKYGIRADFARFYIQTEMERK